jgi:hypothetical protein
MHSQLPSSPLVRVSGNLRVIWKTFLSDTLLALDVVEPESVPLLDDEVAYACAGFSPDGCLLDSQ